MDETYRALGKAHQEDLDREAQNRRLAAIARAAHAEAPMRPARRRKRWLGVVPRLAALRLTRAS